MTADEKLDALFKPPKGVIGIPTTHYVCPHCERREEHRGLSKKVVFEGRPTNSDTKRTPANSIEAAREHHTKHGDMDGHTCLLAECALHYPKSRDKHRKRST